VPNNDILNTQSNKWKDIVYYINSHDKFTRKDMCNFIKGFGQTEDQYVLVIKHVGFLDKPKLATYVRKMKIPENISFSKMSKLAYDTDYAEEKRKIKIIIQRKEKLEKLSNEGR